MILLTGFGPFQDILDNPSAALALALDGAQAGPLRISSMVLPVSYQRAIDQVIARVRELSPLFVVGLGVARTRKEVTVERWGRPDAGRPDIDGRCPERLGQWPPYESPLAAALAQALGAPLSDDAGRYVCNAWLYLLGNQLHQDVAFVHIPPTGLESDRLHAALVQVATARTS